jgi:hypothetical protein
MSAQKQNGTPTAPLILAAAHAGIIAVLGAAAWLRQTSHDTFGAQPFSNHKLKRTLPVLAERGRSI